MKELMRAVPSGKILYADSNGIMRHVMKDVLNLAGFSVELCSEGVITRAHIESRLHYDVMLLDNDLPRIGGVELVKFARQLAHRRETPIVVFSLDDRKEEVICAGANEFVKKPSDLLSLAEAAGRWVTGPGRR